MSLVRDDELGIGDKVNPRMISLVLRVLVLDELI